MKKSRFTEVQIVSILKEYETGKKTTDICREHGISVPTFYCPTWHPAYTWMC